MTARSPIAAADAPEAEPPRAPTRRARRLAARRRLAAAPPAARGCCATSPAARSRSSCPTASASPAAAPLPGPHAAIALHRWRALRRLALAGDIGLAESYRDGDWTHARPDRAARVRHPQRSRAGAARSTRRGRRAGSVAPVHVARANTRRGSRQNIAFHYDLGNDFYAQLARPGADLLERALRRRRRSRSRTAQAAKLARIAELLRLDTLRADGGVLEIGCGWGALALDAGARVIRARVTGLTLSTRAARARARRASTRRASAERVDLRLQDYRDVDGRVRPHRLDRDARGGRRALLAGLLRDAARAPAPGRHRRDPGDHDRRRALRQVPARRRLHPALHLPRRHAAVARRDARRRPRAPA